MKRLIRLLFVAVLLLSCKETAQERFERLVDMWSEKTIRFPHNMQLTSYLSDTVLTKYGRGDRPYTILNYVDTTGCMGCKLVLPQWRKLIEETDSAFPQKVNVLMVFYPKWKKRFAQYLRNEEFDHYVYMDEHDSLNILNNLAQESHFATFLLDKDDKVVAIGNPVLNPNVKRMYYDVIAGGTGLPVVDVEYSTTMRLSKDKVDLGDFPWGETQRVEVTVANTGDDLLVIHDAVTTCGCVTVEYPKEPIRSGGEKRITIVYQGDKPEYFNKTVTIYCNAKDSPFQLRVSGNAK